MTSESLIAKLEKSKHDLPPTAHNHPRGVGWNEGVDNCIAVIRQHEADMGASGFGGSAPCGQPKIGKIMTQPDKLIGWQPIETAPKCREFLLCIHPVYRCFVGLKSVYGQFVSTIGIEKGYPIKLGPTHWMELPDEPKDSDNG